MRRALVTGATSFIGRRLVERLLREGVSVCAFVRASSAPLGIRADEQVYDGSMESVERVIRRFKPDTIFHLASLSTIAHSAADVDPMEAAILRLGVQLAETAAQRAVSTFILAGSYWQERSAEDPTPACLYAAMKQALEDILRFYAASTTMRTATLRLFSVYGPGDRRGRLVGQLDEARRTGRELALSPGRQVMEMVYIDDAVEAFVHSVKLLSDRPKLSGRAWHVGSGERMSLRELVGLYAKVVGATPVRWGARPYRPREVMVPWSGPRLPGWRPRVRLAEGLRRACA